MNPNSDEENFLQYKKNINKKGINKADIKDIFKLGYCYEFGKGTQQDIIKAFYYYNLSANRNHSKSQKSLGYCYEFGRGTEINLEEAFKWYEMAEQNGYMVSKDKLDKLKNKIQNIEEDNNKKLLSNYINKLNNLVEIYKDDKVLMYKTKKFKIYNYNIGILYHRLKQLENAYNYLEEAAYLKYSQAQKALGYFYKKEKDFLYNEKGISYDNINEIASTWYYLSKGIINID